MDHEQMLAKYRSQKVASPEGKTPASCQGTRLVRHSPARMALGTARLCRAASALGS